VVPNGTAPLEALDKLLGKDAGGKASEAQQSSITEEDLALDVDFGALTLTELAASPEKDRAAPPLRRRQTHDERTLYALGI
jgi:hypothetical protein